MKTKRNALRLFITVSGTTDFTELTNHQIDLWHGRLIKEGKAGKTVNNYKDHLVSCLKYLDRHGYRLKINFDLLERAEEDHHEAAYFTRKNILAIKACCQGPRELLLISLLFDSALRISELRSLKLENLDGVKIRVLSGKGRRDRVTFMTPATRALLDQWLALVGSGGYLFPSPRKYGEALSEVQIRESVNRPIRAAGFVVGSAHTLRHSSVTDLIESGADLFTVQTLVGHTDPKTTRRYYHQTNNQLEEKYARFKTAE